MALATANGYDVVECNFRVPRRGVWHADLYVDSKVLTDLNEDVTVEFEGGDTWVGHVLASGAYLDGVYLRMYGGKGGFGMDVAPKFYSQSTVRVVVGDMLREAGESLDSGSDSTILDTQLPTWTRITQRLGNALDLLNRYAIPASIWRVLPGGTVWLGNESWPTSTAVADILSASQHEGRFEFGQDIPTIMPGTTLVTEDYGDLKIDRVESRILSDRVRTTIWVAK